MESGESLSSTLWRVLRPKSTEILLYTLAVLMLVAISVYEVSVRGNFGVESQDLVAFMQRSAQQVGDYLSGGDFWAKFFLFGFWFMIGTLAYFIVWFLINVVVDLYNDIVISAAFVHPRAFHQSDYWLSIAGRVAVRVSAAIALGFYVTFWLWVLTPAWVHSFEALFVDKYKNGEVVDAIVAIGLIAITLHIAVILLRLSSLKRNR